MHQPGAHIYTSAQTSDSVGLNNRTSNTYAYKSTDLASLDASGASSGLVGLPPLKHVGHQATCTPQQSVVSLDASVKQDRFVLEDLRNNNVTGHDVTSQYVSMTSSHLPHIDLSSTTTWAGYSSNTNSGGAK